MNISFEKVPEKNYIYVSWQDDHLFSAWHKIVYVDNIVGKILNLLLFTMVSLKMERGSTFKATKFLNVLLSHNSRQ